MRKITTYLLLTVAILTFTGCGGDRRNIGNSGYAVVHPESWNPDGHPGIFLYYKRTQIWFNVFCSEQGYHDGTLVFAGDIPGSLFGNETPGENEITDFSRSEQLFVVRGTEPPVIISERLFNRSLKTSLPFTVQSIDSATNGLSVKFLFYPNENSNKIETNLFVSWQEVQSWLHEAETSAPVKTSRLGSYRFLPMKQP
jgi:hypothetical protein